MLKPGKGAGARGGGPRGMGEEVGSPGAGARHATQPAPGTAAGGGTGDHGRYVDHALTLYEPELSFCLAGSDDPKDCEM
jgi:hypothetical protein